jgi:hypothetical protein
MSRLSQPARSEFDDREDLEGFDAVVERRRRIGMAGEEQETPDLGEYFGAMVNSPRLCALAAGMGTFVRTAGERPGSYSHADREFVDQVLSVDFGTNVVQKLHVPDAVAAGVRLEAIEALRQDREEDLNEDERLLARFIRQVVGGDVDDETFAAIQARLGTRGVVEYAGFILWLQWTIRMTQALGGEDPPDEEINRIVRELKDGSREVPDFRKRLG